MDIDTFLKDFLPYPDVQKLSDLTKSDLLSVAMRYELDVQLSLRKNQILETILFHFIDDDILEEDALEVIPGYSSVSLQLAKYKLDIDSAERIKQMENEKELRLRRMELDAALKRMEIQMMIDKLEDMEVHQERNQMPSPILESKFMEENEVFADLNTALSVTSVLKKSSQCLSQVEIDLSETFLFSLFTAYSANEIEDLSFGEPSQTPRATFIPIPVVEETLSHQIID